MKTFSQQESKQLISNTVVFAISTFVSKAIVFVLLPIYTIYMTAPELGAAELTVTLVNLIFPLASLNILSATLRYAMDDKINRNAVFWSTFCVLSIGLLVTGCFLYSHNWLGWSNSQNRYALLLLITYSIGQLLSVFTKAVGLIRTFAIGNVLYAFFLLVFNLMFVMYMKRGTGGYLEALALSNVLMSFFFIIILLKSRPINLVKVDGTLLREMLVFSLPLVVNSISWWLANFCDRYILNYFEGNSSVGIYAVSAKIPSLVTVAASVFMQAWVLSAIKAYDKGNCGDFFSMVAEKFSAFFLIGSSFIMLLSKPVSLVIARNDFNSSWLYVPFLVCAAVFSNFGNFYSAVYTSAKKNFSVMLSTMFGAALNVVLNILLIPKFSIQGVVLATMISQFFVFVYRMFDSRKFIQFGFNKIKVFVSFVILLTQASLIVRGFPWWTTAFNCVLIALMYKSEWICYVNKLYKK